MGLYSQMDESKKSVQKNKDLRNIDDKVDFYLEDEIPVKEIKDKTNTLLEDLSGNTLGYLLQKIQTTNSIPDLFIFMGLILFIISSKKQTNQKKKKEVLLMLKKIMDLHNL